MRELVHAESAIVLEPGKEYLVESRLLQLARQAGHDHVDGYVAHLSQRRPPTGLRQVVEALTTNETSWFRDVDPFTTLKSTVFPTLAANRTERRLRGWAAACSSGQEPYSIAMTAMDTPALAAVNVIARGGCAWYSPSWCSPHGHHLIQSLAVLEGDRCDEPIPPSAQ